MTGILSYSALAGPTSKGRAAMGRRGRQIVIERFSARSMVHDMERLYLELLTGHGVVAEGRPAGGSLASSAPRR